MEAPLDFILDKIVTVWGAVAGAVMAAITVFGIMVRSSGSRMNAYLTSTDGRLSRMSKQLDECQEGRRQDTIYIARLEALLMVSKIDLPQKP